MSFPANFQISRSRLTQGRAEGLEQIEVGNGVLRVTVLPQRGMGIHKVSLGEQEFGWRSPVSGPVHPMWVPVSDASGLGWLEGFDELMCRCGLQSNGPPVFDASGRLAFPLHGRIANLPAENVRIHHDEASGALEVVGVVREVRFLHTHLRLTSRLAIRANEASFTLVDEVANLSPVPADCQLMYHYNVGLPWLGRGARVVAPIREIAPRDSRAAEGIEHWSSIEAPEPGFAEQVYYAKLHAQSDGTTRVLLRDAQGASGTGLRFKIQQLPCFVVWKHGAGEEDGYVVGIEPSTNFPNPRPFEIGQQRMFTLEPRASQRFELQFDFHGSDEEVREAERQIEALQSSGRPQVFSRPRPGWSPDA